MTITKRVVSLAATAVLALFIGSAAAQAPSDASTYPDKRIRVIVPFAPGGAADLMARTVGQKLSEAWGQPVVIENRAGAGGNIGADLAAKSPPDGYTLFLVDAGHTTAVSLYKKLTYDLVRDFVPVTLVTVTPLIVVTHPSLPVKTIGELLALARKQQLNFGSGGTGSATQLAGILFNSMGKVSMVDIPYKSVPPAIPDLLDGRLAVMFLPAPVAAPYITSGKLNALAVTTATRSTAWPDLPTVAEAGIPGYDSATWSGFMVPTGTPEPIVAKLNAEIVRILSLPDVRNTLTSQGSKLVGNTRAEFGEFIKQDIAKMSQVVKQLGTQID